jgi:signal transduction histidine kinase
MINKLRGRLTVYNTIILILFLTLFSVVVYLLMNNHVFNRLNNNLDLAAERVQNLCELPAIPVNCIYVLRDEQLDITTLSKAPITEENKDFIAMTIREYAEIAIESGKEMYVDFNVEGRGMIRVLSVPVEKGGQKGVVQVLINIDRELSFMKVLLTTLIILNVISIFLLALINWLLVGKSLVPVRHAWEQQKEFIADASHEIRTPLSVIQANLDALIVNQEKSVVENLRWINNIKTETQQMAKLTEDLLLLAKKDANQLQFQREYIDLSRVVKETIEEIRPLYNQAQIKLELNNNQTVYLFADEFRIKQLLIILLDNALKYTPANGRVQVNVSSSDSEVHLAVIDNGIGIKKEEQHLIFERFYRVDKTRSREAGGTGLGLPIAAWIIEEHGGTIHLESSLNTGTIFKIVFPVK